MQSKIQARTPHFDGCDLEKLWPVHLINKFQAPHDSCVVYCIARRTRWETAHVIPEACCRLPGQYKQDADWEPVLRGGLEVEHSAAYWERQMEANRARAPQWRRQGDLCFVSDGLKHDYGSVKTKKRKKKYQNSIVRKKQSLIKRELIYIACVLRGEACFIHNSEEGPNYTRYIFSHNFSKLLHKH